MRSHINVLVRSGRKGTIFIFEEITLVLSGGQIGWSREMQGNYLLSIARVLVTDDNSLDLKSGNG